MNEQDIVDMYVNQKQSPYVIAEKYNTYPNKIRRLLKKRGIELNNKSVAQKNALETGRTKHPTQGQKRDDAVKEKISETLSQNWKNISEKEREKRVDSARQQWYNMSENERENLRKAAAIAVRQAAKDGSQIEQFLFAELIKAGYNPLFHEKGLIPNQNMEIDIFVPGLNTAIEIDGPAHFYPIWGEENLQKHIKSDSHKSGLLLNCGFMVVRIKHMSKSLSQKNKRDVLREVLSILGKIKEKFPEKGNRYIEVEIE